MTNKLNAKGFTLIELLMAMAFFSFILLFMTTGFLIVNRAYNKGLSVKLIQDEGRQLVEELTREIRSTSTIDTKDKCIYINGYRYHWEISFDTSNAQSPGKLYKEVGKNCSEPFIAPYGELVLHERVGVQHMALESIGGGAHKLTVVLSTSKMDILDYAGAEGEDTTCDDSKVGSQYCDVVKYTTVVSSR